ncbi:MAG TPA: type III secretion chaperone SycN [Candidatus Competibacteraceae bacterium]|nr:MAG: type III secretion chaperone SycN [Candidatus Competibacteraceae bacterium]HOB61137.1 type III secretion chaperone SycN [Candidatus Competibacteraceae bacterium]HQA24786.1 type III secretion chaperone SycN [Candidatus Competibacteraceae bacterium]HQD55460.1 type III secretion chaperone SycN [Candidatus Competibacteraceae bacterium]
MSAASMVLTEFGQSLGLTDFRWPDAGMAAFAFDARGTLYLEERDEVLLVYLVRPLDPHRRSPELLKSALRLCHYRQQWPYVVQAGLQDESQLVFLARLPVREVTLPELEQALDLLTRLHDRCAERA